VDTQILIVAFPTIEVKPFSLGPIVIPDPSQSLPDLIGLGPSSMISWYSYSLSKEF
jgi:hypothetical protein